jgi:hypothetical protein
MKSKVKVGGSVPSKTPKAMKCEGPRPAPMASNKMSRKTVRGAGAATRGKSYMG